MRIKFPDKYIRTRGEMKRKSTCLRCGMPRRGHVCAHDPECTKSFLPFETGKAHLDVGFCGDAYPGRATFEVNTEFLEWICTALDAA